MVIVIVIVIVIVMVLVLVVLVAAVAVAIQHLSPSLNNKQAVAQKARTRQQTSVFIVTATTAKLSQY